MEPRSEYLTRNVFVAGGIPEVTYNPRNERHLEAEVLSYLEQPGRALSVSGPTKSGKTVLIERMLPRDEAIWIYGSDLTSVDALWMRVIDWLGLYDSLEVSEQVTAQRGAEFGATAGAKGVASVNVGVSTSGGTAGGRKLSRKRSLADVARDGLQIVRTPIVIDDFHYISNDVKRGIARAIKSVVPLAPVAMIAVPHEAFEVVHEEPDMGGRVWQLRIEHWTEEELLHISRTGFEALNILDDDEEVARHLAAVSYGAPFLMQQLCYETVVAQGILRTADAPVTLVPPDDWDEFFKRIADRSAPAVFGKLLKGPNPRGQERISRVFKDGLTTDIYGAVLRSIALTGPKPKIRYQEIVKILEEQLLEPARGQQVTSSLSHMASIADESRGTGDPALDYKYDELHILDPFLLFYLRFGSWEISTT